MRRDTPAALLLAAVLGLAPLPAAADAIDGHWCAEDRPLSFTIDGPTIITPAGASLAGTYDRHDYSYTVPAGEADAGSEIFMTLVDENTIHLIQGRDRTRVETWKRCGPGA